MYNISSDLINFYTIYLFEKINYSISNKLYEINNI